LEDFLKLLPELTLDLDIDWDLDSQAFAHCQTAHFSSLQEASEYANNRGFDSTPRLSIGESGYEIVFFQVM